MLKKIHKHYPISFSYKIKYKNGIYKNSVTYVGENSAEVFVELMKKESINVMKIYKKMFQ